MAAFERHGMMAVLIPSILPPPAPFKIFVLLAGVAGISAPRFAAAIAHRARRPLLRRRIARGPVRRRAMAYMHEHGTTVALMRRSALLVAGFARLSPLVEAPPAAADTRETPVECSQSMTPDLSVVIPIHNEAPSLAELHRELTDTLDRWGRSYEIIVVDDGSTDDSFAISPACRPSIRVCG